MGWRWERLAQSHSKYSDVQHRAEYSPTTDTHSIKSNRRSRLTKGTDELSLYSPGDCGDERGGGEASKQHVVQEDNVEVPKPVVTAKVSQ